MMRLMSDQRPWLRSYPSDVPTTLEPYAVVEGSAKRILNVMESFR